jgi:hypothetical protein
LNIKEHLTAWAKPDCNRKGKRETGNDQIITTRNLPEEFSGTYEAKGVFNIVKNKFIPLDANKTKHITESEFQFGGLMKLMGIIMPGAFKKQSLKYMNDFKTFAEQKGIGN